MKTLAMLAVVLLLITATSVFGQSKQDPEQLCYEALSGYPAELSSTPRPDLPSSLDGVELVLFESGCYGSCPSFTATFSSSKVEFEGHAFVKAKGKRKTKIDPKLFEQFVLAWFDSKMYAMRDDYCRAKCPDGTLIVVTDIAESSISLKGSKWAKEVHECYFTINHKPARPKPPEQYDELRKKMIEFLKIQRWI